MGRTSSRFGKSANTTGVNRRDPLREEGQKRNEEDRKLLFGCLEFSESTLGTNF